MPSTPKSERILVVDGDETAREIISSMLVSAGRPDTNLAKLNRV
jgi:CheY-like chemotaxis protein